MKKIILLIMLAFIVSAANAQVKQTITTENRHPMLDTIHNPTLIMGSFADRRVIEIVCYKDSSNLIKVYINRRKIHWTSDSTFTFHYHQ